MILSLQKFSEKIPGKIPFTFQSCVYHLTKDRNRGAYITGVLVQNGLEQRVRKLEDWSARMEERVVIHLASCEKRGARLERLAWGIGSVVLSSFGATLWMLAKSLARNGVIP